MRIIITTLFLFSIAFASAQTSSEIAMLREAGHSHTHKTVWEVALDNNSTMEILLSSLFLFYKAFISSQDVQSCGFHPSCSVYAVETIKKQGMFKGLLDTFDRLTRCNGFSPEKYEFDPNTMLLIDPVTNIKYHAL